MKIYSRIPGHEHELLHIINRAADRPMGREDIVPASETLQCASIKLNLGSTFKPHKHIEKICSPYTVPQESWVVIKGKVEATLYDLDDTIINYVMLRAGDISITLKGGHNYEIKEMGTHVLEFKTGPYSGQENDKVFI